MTAETYLSAPIVSPINYIELTITTIQRTGLIAKAHLILIHVYHDSAQVKLVIGWSTFRLWFIIILPDWWCNVLLLVIVHTAAQCTPGYSWIAFRHVNTFTSCVDKSVLNGFVKISVSVLGDAEKQQENFRVVIQQNNNTDMNARMELKGSSHSPPISWTHNEASQRQHLVNKRTRSCNY